MDGWMGGWMDRERERERERGERERGREGEREREVVPRQGLKVGWQIPAMVYSPLQLSGILT